MNPLVVIIPSRTAANLAASIRAVVNNEPDARVVVVDDGVDFESLSLYGDHSVEFAEGVKPFVFSRNINIGIRAAGDDADVVLLNDDAILETPGGFTLMQQAAEQYLRVGIIGATTNLTGQPLQRPLPKDHPQFGLREVEHIAFVCVLIPARTRRALHNWTEGIIEHTAIPQQERQLFSGGFLDERYTGYGSEDLDYCMQVRRAEMGVFVHDGCYVDHGSLTSSYRGLPTQAGNIWPNHRLLRAKWGLQPPYHPSDPEGKR